MLGGYKFAIDRGGTFTDVWAMTPDGNVMVLKLLSEDPANYKDAPTEGIRRILTMDCKEEIEVDGLIDGSRIDWIRMGTTVATNALLEKKGERFALALTKGFKDLYVIGDQSRMELFNLNIAKNETLYEEVVEVDERIVLQQDSCQLNNTNTNNNINNNNTNNNNNNHLEDTSTADKIEVWRPVKTEEVRASLQGVYARGIRSLAISFLHSYLWDGHEQQVARIAREVGFEEVELSSHSANMPKILQRGSTACVNSYLTPCLGRYVSSFFSAFHHLPSSKVLFMQSNGGLTDVESLTGSKALLSGPAGGVVGCSLSTPLVNTTTPVIGLDMGGTSTDVSRYAGVLEEVMEISIASIHILSPQLDIETVAAGGGSILTFRSGLFYAGPHSAGAHPGPMSYRKGGPLTITDANLMLGRLLPSYFPKVFGPKEDLPLDLEGVQVAFAQLTHEINQFNQQNRSKLMTPHEVALGFVAVANEAMSRPIRNLTEAKGLKTSDHVLNCFGGAAGQHCCSIATNLHIKTVFVHKYSSLLSAYGLALADVVQEQLLPCSLLLQTENYDSINKMVEGLMLKCCSGLQQKHFSKDNIQTVVYLHMRFERTESCLMITNGAKYQSTYDCKLENVQQLFYNKFEQEFGFLLQDREVVVESVRVKALGKSFFRSDRNLHHNLTPSQPHNTTEVYFKEGILDTPVYQLDKCCVHQSIQGPAILIDQNSTLLIEPGAVARFTRRGDIMINMERQRSEDVDLILNPIHLSLFSNRFMSIAEQMGRILQRTAVSTNIKERLDFSCALFGGDGGLVSNAPHIPVHLGSMQQAVQYQLRSVGEEMEDGDVILSNHPSAGGSHLPDLTVITPVFYQGHSSPVFFVANRGHHADIGGTTPGSMPSNSTHLHEEGATFKSFWLVKKAVFNERELVERLKEPAKHPGCKGSRNMKDNISDLHAQIAANKKGQSLMMALIESYGLAVVQFYMQHIQLTTKHAVCALMKSVAEKIEGSVKVLIGEDKMDGGFVIKLTVTIRPDGTSVFDFSGTSSQVHGNINAPTAVAYSAIIYCLRCMLNKDIPLNQGCLEPIEVVIPAHSLISPSVGAAVVGGNVLTSQRLVDVIFKTFQVCAASQGCMNNVSFGDDTVGYYETVAGGAGAGPDWQGRSGVHTHMTNTRITDVEILEKRYPIVIRSFHLNEGSGGRGRYRGGEGVVREFMFRRPLTLSVLSERRVLQPYGMKGGGAGACGMNSLQRQGVSFNLGGKCTVDVKPWDVFRLCTPGGGGYGEE